MRLFAYFSLKKQKMKRVLVMMMMLVVQKVFCQIPQPGKDTYVNDFAHVLTADQISTLNAQIDGFVKNTGSQIAIVLVDTIPTAYEIKDYALLIGRKWHVGTDKNGIVYVAAIKQHKQRLQIATGLYQTLPKDKREAILEQVKPYFKQQDYAGGLKVLVSGVGDALNADLGVAPNAPAAATPVAPQNNQSLSNVSDPGFYVGIIFFFVPIILIVVVIIVRRNRRRSIQMHSNIGSGFGNGPIYNDQGSGVGPFVAGAAAGYVAERLIDGLNNNIGGNQNDAGNNNQPQSNNLSDNSNWGSDDSSSSDDSGFSSDSSDSDSGSSSDW
jgi:uncharacterized protein